MSNSHSEQAFAYVSSPQFYFVDVSFLHRLVRECTYAVYIRRGILDIGSRLAVKVHTNSIYREGSALLLLRNVYFCVSYDLI